MRFVAGIAAVLLLAVGCTAPVPPLPPAAAALYIGSYQLLDNERPGISGILTSQIDKEQMSVRAYGWFGGVGGGEPVTLGVLADSPSGQQRLTLRPDSPDRFVGMGESSFRWGPNGPIELTRTR
jgi:hypothetical protein